MQKKFFLTLNILLLAALLTCTYVYMEITGKLVMKGITASCFVALGLVNLTYAALTKPRKLAFPVVLAFGLCFAMAGDLLLGWNFILGAGLFALGHILYAAAMYTRQRFDKLDALMSLVMFVIAMAILTFTPNLTFSDPVMRIVCYVYAVIISCMAGKAVSGFLRERTLTNSLLALGSVMFYFSDVMLLLAWFAGAGRWADVCCLCTYFPGQGILAHVCYHHVRENAA
ncbi:MAG: lysoplasmalogenase [Clostridiales bacterium]|nr:lysoplasmalogenase [Clostridiales bacterium]MBE5811929.1 lysoplasmalogenase [Clostridiales bacterium]